MTFGFLCETTGFFLTGGFFTGGVGMITRTGAVSVAVTFGPVGGVPTAVATLSKSACTFATVQVYFLDSPGCSVPRARLQSGASGSVTVTFVSGTSPVFVTVISKVAVAPCWIVCDFGFFRIVIAGCGTRTRTRASSLAVTSGPSGGVPVATATFVKASCTFARVHV